MTDVVKTLASQNGHADPARKIANLSPIGATGVVTYGGILFTQDYDRAWQGIEKDRTILQMLNDPVLGSCLLGIEMLIRRVDWRLEPADESKPAADAADLVESSLKEMRGYWPGDTMAKMLTFLGWGWCCLEIVYRQRDDGWLGWDAWRLIPQQTRRGWEFDDRGEPIALIQIDPQDYHDIVIPLDRCLVLRYASRDNSPEGQTPLRTAFDAWYRKSKIQIVEGIGLERDLAGLPVGRVPGVDIEARSPVFTAMQSIVTGIRQDAQAGLVLASDRDPANGQYVQEFSLLSTGGARAIDTDPIVRRYANEMVTIFLANVMRTGQDGTGSYALSQTQGGLFQQAIAAHLDTIGDAITTQALPRLLAVNGLDAALTPKLVHGDIETADLAELGTYLTNLATAGLLNNTPELVAFVHEVAGLPTPTVDEIAKQRADEDAARAKAEAAAKKAAEAQPAPSSTAAEPPVDALAGATPGGPVTASEARRFVEADGSLTLSDLTEILAFWKANVPAEYADLLNATVIGDGGK